MAFKNGPFLPHQPSPQPRLFDSCARRRKQRHPYLRETELKKLFIDLNLSSDLVMPPLPLISWNQSQSRTGRATDFDLPRLVSWPETQSAPAQRSATVLYWASCPKQGAARLRAARGRVHPERRVNHRHWVLGQDQAK
jgi:hypothetical protein